jgi:two-component system osmolarity sensor histidine kinase EnvZ
LANLLENALKYGGGEIDVSLQHDAQQFFIHVSDCGSGIPTEQLESAKRPFVRLQSARSDSSGSGLGLAIVERAAQAHQGRLVLAQREGGGLMATLQIPITHPLY